MSHVGEDLFFGLSESDDTTKQTSHQRYEKKPRILERRRVFSFRANSESSVETPAEQSNWNIQKNFSAGSGPQQHSLYCLCSSDMIDNMFPGGFMGQLSRCNILTWTLITVHC